MYLNPETQSEVQEKFEESSEISLPGFLEEEKFRQVRKIFMNSILIYILLPVLGWKVA